MIVMTKRILSLLLAVCMTAALFAGVIPRAEALSSFRQAIAAANASLPFTTWEFEVIRLANKERLAEGLDPLTTFDALQGVCDVRAEELVTEFDHYRPDGSICWTALTEASVGYNKAAENIAAGQRSPAAVMTSWMNSEGHKANIMNEELTHLGVGHYYDSASTYKNHWVQMFTAKTGEEYESAVVYIPSNLDVGTEIDEMYMYVVLSNSYYGNCYLPISSEMVSDYDPTVAGTQTIQLDFLGFAGSVDITLNSTLAITAQPESVTVASGEKATVTVEATGDELTYEWYYKDADADSFAKTSAFIGNTYSVTMTAARAGRQVYCVITDAYGDQVQSDTATLDMVKNEAVIITQPKSVWVAEGEKASVTVEAEGDGLTYKWYYKNPGASKYTYTSSFKGDTYSITMNEARDGRYVFCKVTDAYGNTVKSKTVSLNMKTPLEIVTQPKSVKVAEGEKATVTVEAKGDGLTYKWYYKNPGASSYSYTSSFTGNSYSVTMNEERDGRYVFCRVYDKWGNMVKTNTVSLRMK